MKLKLKRKEIFHEILMKICNAKNFSEKNYVEISLILNQQLPAVMVRRRMLRLCAKGGLRRSRF